MLLAGYPCPDKFYIKQGTVTYQAPELVEVDNQRCPTGQPTCAGHHQAADIWAAACTTFRILTNHLLFTADVERPVPQQMMQVRQQHASLVRLHCLLLLSWL